MLYTWVKLLYKFLIYFWIPGPDDQLLKRFSDWWDKAESESGFPDETKFTKWNWSKKSKSMTSRYCKDSLLKTRKLLLEDSFERGDYQELCELVNIILGGEVEYQSNVFDILTLNYFQLLLIAIWSQLPGKLSRLKLIAILNHLIKSPRSFAK